MMMSRPRQLKNVGKVDRRTVVKYKTLVLLSVMTIDFLLTGIDVLMAHSQNAYFRWELIPLIYSPAAVLAVLARMVFQSSDVVRRLFLAVMWLGVVVGVTGSFLHLMGNAPAKLAYTGSWLPALPSLPRLPSLVSPPSRWSVTAIAASPDVPSCSFWLVLVFWVRSWLPFSTTPGSLLYRAIL